MVQPLTTEVIQERLGIANQLGEMIDRQNFDPTSIIFTDEAHFSLGGYVNRQNFRIWGSENPHMTIPKPLHPAKVSVWAGICAKDIIGPIFPEDNETITGDVYNRILNEAFPKLKALKLDRSYYWQQDGPPPHRT